MQIARLTPADAMAYKGLMLHAYEHAADSFTSTPQERDSWWVNRIHDPAGLSVVWGAFTEAGLVGTVSVEFSARAKTRHKALIVAMFVREECRGEGVARELMCAAIQHGLHREGLRLLQLEVTQGNVPAERLYQSLGFQSFGIEPMAVLTPSGYRSKVHMWLDLNLAKNHA
ncbi:MAG: GNAT family N-acetyltransferase [Limnohabitans sp.]